jgi:hypothetical protein
MVPTSPEPENWPVFGMHYQIVRLFSDLLAALDSPQATRDPPKTPNLDDILIQLETWESATILSNYGLHVLLYISAAKLLAYYHMFVSSAREQYSVLVQQELDQCISSLSKIDVTKTAFTRYFNWPLAIIDRVIQDTRASHVVQQKLKDVIHVDPAGKKAYDWVAEGFERRFKPR